MNIFMTSANPVECARALDDKRVVKMVLETAQILSTVMSLNGQPAPYKPTHTAHPCVKWVAHSVDNWMLALNHFEALLSEYTHRYGKIHSCAQHLTAFRSHVKDHLGSANTGTTPANCTTHLTETDIYQAYRKHLIDKWNADKLAPKWTNRQPPTWR